MTAINLYGPGGTPAYGTIDFKYYTLIPNNIVAPYPGGTTVTEVLLKSIVYTNGQAISFEYNTSGELLKMNNRAAQSAGRGDGGTVRGYLRYDYITQTSTAGPNREVQFR